MRPCKVGIRLGIFLFDQIKVTVRLTAGLTSSNGANLSWPDAFGVPDTAPKVNPRESGFYDHNSWIVGVVNAGK